MGYRLVDNKCELLCDFRYFHKALFAWRPPTDELEKHEAGAVPAFYKKTQNHFDCAKKYFAQRGFLYGEYGSDSTSEADAAEEAEYHRSLVTNLGGVSHDGNWSGTAHQLVARYSIPGTRLYRVVPKTEDGRDFAFIGAMPMSIYVGDTNGSLLLFYDPQERIALTIIDWS